MFDHNRQVNKEQQARNKERDDKFWELIWTTWTQAERSALREEMWSGEGLA